MSFQAHPHEALTSFHSCHDIVFGFGGPNEASVDCACTAYTEAILQITVDTQREEVEQ